MSPNGEARPPRRESGPKDERPGDGHVVACRIARLKPDDRERLLDRLETLRDLDRLAREEPALVEVTS